MENIDSKNLAFAVKFLMAIDVRRKANRLYKVLSFALYTLSILVTLVLLNGNIAKTIVIYAFCLVPYFYLWNIT